MNQALWMSAGLLGTSAVIDWDHPAVAATLPDEVTTCAIAVAELTAGARLASTVVERSGRQSRLQKVEVAFNPLPFDVPAGMVRS